MNVRFGVLLLCTTASPAFAGISMTTSRGPERSEQLQVEGNKLRVDSKGESRSMTQIFDGDSGKFYGLDESSKTYRVFDKQSMQQMRERMLANVPAEQRKMIEERMKAAEEAPSKKLEFKATGEKKTVAGFACEGYTELLDGKPLAQGCYIPWAKAGISKSDLQVFHKMAELLSSMGGGRRMQDAAVERFEQSPGLPAERATLGPEGKPGATETLVSLKHEKIPASRFEVPSGYTEAPAGPMGGMGGPGGMHGPGHGGLMHRPAGGGAPGGEAGGAGSGE